MLRQYDCFNDYIKKSAIITVILHITKLKIGPEIIQKEKRTKSCVNLSHINWQFFYEYA